MSWSWAPGPDAALCSRGVYEGAGGPLLTVQVTVAALKADFGMSCCQPCFPLCFSVERLKQLKSLL